MKFTAMGAFLHLLPFEAQESMTGAELQVLPSPWGSPLHAAVIGHEPSDPSAAIMQICYEWPINWLRTTERLTTLQVEYGHVGRFRSDYALALGQLPFWSVEQGDDPPDLLVATADGQCGMECTRLALPQRQNAHGLFRAVRSRIAQVEPAAFAHLMGQVVYLWFDNDGTLGVPLRRSDEEAAAELVNAMAQHRPDATSMWIDDGELPESAKIPQQSTSSGATFYCVPMTGAVPDSVLFNWAGFEVGLAFTSSHRVTAEWGALINRIQAKDRPGSDWLLISAGAPDKLGVTYPSEEAVAVFLLQHPTRIPPLEHLERVTIHLWSVGRAIDIYPEQEDVFGPLYQGTSPGHRPISASDVG